MHISSKVGYLGRTLLLLVLIGLLLSMVLATKRHDPRPIGDKSKPWYRGQENLEKLFLTKRDLPTAPFLDYSQDCMLCHNKYYDRWWNSGHASSYNNQFFQDSWQHYREWWLYETTQRRRLDKTGRFDASLKKGMDEQPEWALEITKTDCLSCHAPSINATIKYTDDLEMRNVLLAMREGYVPNWRDVVSGFLDKDLEYDYGTVYFDEITENPNFDVSVRKQIRFLQRISDLTKDGISCDFCHTVTRVSHVADREDDLHRMHNMNYSLNFEHRFGMKKWGPIEETPTASHTIQYSPAYRMSEYCAACHQEVNDFGIKVQDTYNEWKFSEWAHTGVTCQSCHMPEYRSVVSKHGQIRDDAHDHSFAGVDDAAFLATAADLEMTSERVDDYIDLTISIINNGTGHSLPTGIPFRRVVLVVRAKDEMGEIFWDARQLDVDDAFLAAMPDEYWSGRGEYPTFQRLLGRSYPSIYENTEEVPYWVADTVIEDTRIMANETRELHFRIPAAEQPGAVYVTGQLFFRRTSAKYGEYFDIVDSPEIIDGVGITVS